MESRSSNIINLSLAVLAIFVVALIITLLFQNRRINSLKEELNNTVIADNSQPVTNERTFSPENKKKNSQSGPEADIFTFEDKVSPAQKIIYENKIKKLESQINDMQAWQDYLEKTVQQQSKAEEERKTSLLNARKSYIATRLEPFTEQNNLPPEIISSLIELRYNEQLEIEETARDITRPEEINVERMKDLIQEQTDINKRYDEEIARLLSEKDYAAYKEYQKLEIEWGIVGQMKNDFISRDLKLEKSQERRLVAAMHENRQKMIEIQAQKATPMKSFEQPSQEEMLKQSLEYQETINAMHIESARDILSEPQLQIYERYFNNQTYLMERALSGNLQGAITVEKEIDD